MYILEVESNDRKRAAFKLIFAVLIFFGVSACTTQNNLQSPKIETKQQFKLDSAGRKVADPLAEVTVNSMPGSLVPVVLDSGKSVMVKVGKDYISASGDNCRSIYVRKGNGLSQRNAVCSVGSVWTTVVPLKLD